MNFYSDDIILDIIEKHPKNVEECIDKFYNDATTVLFYISYKTISTIYTEKLIDHHQTKIAFYCMDTAKFTIGNCPSGMIYHKHEENDSICYYILFICTQHKFKKFGYASMMLTNFIERVKNETQQSSKIVKIVTSSLETAVTYYENFGFKWTRKSLIDYPRMLRFENYNKNQEYFMMELIINDAVY